MNPEILGTGIALPETRVSQEDVLRRLVLPSIGGGERAARIFRNSAVEARHTVLSDLTYHFVRRTTQERNDLFVKHAPPLAERAARACLADAGCDAARVDELITVSCTGIETPGPDLWLAERLPLRPDARRAHIGAMGCYATLPALYRACSAVRADPGLLVMVVAVELCTLHFQHERSAENLVVSALFGDGAAAVLIGAPRGDARSGPRFLHFATWTNTAGIDRMGFHLTDHGLKMALSQDVPERIEESAAAATDHLLAGAASRREEIAFWLVHPGGVRILDAVERALSLPADALEPSRRILRAYGNVSSATSLFLLDAHRRGERPPSGRKGVLLAFGPGLTQEGAVMES